MCKKFTNRIPDSAEYKCWYKYGTWACLEDCPSYEGHSTDCNGWKEADMWFIDLNDCDCGFADNLKKEVAEESGVKEEYLDKNMMEELAFQEKLVTYKINAATERKRKIDHKKRADKWIQLSKKICLKAWRGEVLTKFEREIDDLIAREMEKDRLLKIEIMKRKELWRHEICPSIIDFPSYYEEISNKAGRKRIHNRVMKVLPQIHDALVKSMTSNKNDIDKLVRSIELMRQDFLNRKKYFSLNSKRRLISLYEWRNGELKKDTRFIYREDVEKLEGDIRIYETAVKKLMTRQLEWKFYDDVLPKYKYVEVSEQEFWEDKNLPYQFEEDEFDRIWTLRIPINKKRTIAMQKIHPMIKLMSLLRPEERKRYIGNKVFKFRRGHNMVVDDSCKLNDQEANTIFCKYEKQFVKNMRELTFFKPGLYKFNTGTKYVYAIYVNLKFFYWIRNGVVPCRIRRGIKLNTPHHGQHNEEFQKPFKGVKIDYTGYQDVKRAIELADTKTLADSYCYVIKGKIESDQDETDRMHY